VCRERTYLPESYSVLSFSFRTKMGISSNSVKAFWISRFAKSVPTYLNSIACCLRNHHHLLLLHANGDCISPRYTLRDTERRASGRSKDAIWVRIGDTLSSMLCGLVPTKAETYFLCL
jgi:hypothetical protein